MLGCLAETLTRFRHNHPRKPQDQPYPYINPHYGAKAKYAEATDVSPPISKEHKKIPGSHGYPLVLCKGSGSNHAYCTWLHHGSESQPNWENYAKSQAIIRLCGLTSICRPRIPIQLYGPCRPQRHLVVPVYPVPVYPVNCHCVFRLPWMLLTWPYQVSITNHWKIVIFNTLIYYYVQYPS